MNVSILISTWNNSKRLEITLGAFVNCEIPESMKWEIVLVNNNCTDNTVEIIRTYGSKLPILYVFEPHQGLSWARNAGLKAASGELIIFTDDDVRPNKEWIKSYWQAFQDKKSGYYFGGPIQPEFESKDYDAELIQWAPFSVKGLDFGPKERLLTDKEVFIGPNWACPRYALDKIGNFDVDKGLNPSSRYIKVGEEIDIMNKLKRIGLKPLYLPMAGLMHFVPLSKCVLNHISKRVEAGSYFATQNEIENSGDKLIAKFPKWLYKSLVLSYLKWITVKLLGKKGYEEYLSIWVIRGRLRAVRERSMDNIR